MAIKTEGLRIPYELPEGGTLPEIFLGDLPTLSGFEKEIFFNRLNQVVTVTGEYGGALPNIPAGQMVDFLDPLGAKPTVVETSADQSHQIQTASRRIRNAGISSVVIEAGHAYMYQDLADLTLSQSIVSQCQHAVALTQRLEADGVEVRQILFVDDYNPDPADGQLHQRLNLQNLLNLVNSAGYGPQLLLRESAMEPLAKKMIYFMGQQNLLKGKIADEGQTAVSPADNINLSRRNIELYRSVDDTVSCAILDAALTIVKFRHLAEGVINVLPRWADGQQFGYRSQQRKMRTIIAEHLGVRISPIFNLFTGDHPVDAIAMGAHHDFRKPR